MYKIIDSNDHYLSFLDYNFWIGQLIFQELPNSVLRYHDNNSTAEILLCYDGRFIFCLCFLTG